MPIEMVFTAKPVPSRLSGDIASLQRFAGKARCERNRPIFHEGDEAAHIYRIVSGVVRLCKHTVQGRRLITHFLFPGDYFGFMQLGAYSFSAEAVTDSALASFPQTQVEALSEKDVSVRENIRALYMNQLAGAQNHLFMLGCLGAAERVESFLAWLRERMGSPEVPMSRQDIADYLGLTVETVCRAFAKLKRAGALAVRSSIGELATAA